MFWQWVSVASWFLGGVLVAMVLNIISDENGKLKLSPTDFEKDFKEKINLKLPEIVEDTVAKQRFNLN